MTTCTYCLWRCKRCRLEVRVVFVYYHFAFLFTNAATMSTETTRVLTRCGWVTQICVFTLQLCRTDDANLRF